MWYHPGMAYNLGKPESVRLWEPEADWLQTWSYSKNQDRTSVIRGAVRLLILLAENVPPEQRVDLLARLGHRKRQELAKEDYKAIMHAAKPLRELLATAASAAELADRDAEAVSQDETRRRLEGPQAG